MMRRSMALLALAGAALAACDYPTEPPSWDQTWQVAGERVSISVAELLPATIGLNADTTAFVAEVPGTSVTLSLGEMCGAECEAANGLVAPKPAFDETILTSTTLPADLVSATLAGGGFPVTMTHDFNFDPLNPSTDPAADKGFISVTVRSDGAVVADTTIRGENHTFPSGATLSPTLNIRPVAVTNEMEIEIRVFSPEGDPVEIDTSDTLSVALAASTLEIAEATVTAGTIEIEPTTTTMDFAGIEQDGPLIDRIQSGALLFRVSNPFTVTGTLDVAFQLPVQTIENQLAIEQGEYEARMDFTGQQLRDILGSDEAELVASGTVTAAGGTITVTPAQELVLENDFEIVLLMGGSDGEA